MNQTIGRGRRHIKDYCCIIFVDSRYKPSTNQFGLGRKPFDLHFGLKIKPFKLNEMVNFF